MSNGNLKLLSWSTDSAYFPNTDINIDDDVVDFIAKLSELPEEQQQQILRVADKLLRKK